MPQGPGNLPILPGPLHLQYKHSLALGFAIESMTASAYDSHLNSYLNFCQLHQEKWILPL